LRCNGYISLRIARYLSRAGLIESDAENSYLAVSTDSELTEYQSYSIQYRISTGFQKGKKVFALQTRLPAFEEKQDIDLLGKVSGFSLHAGVSAQAHQRDKLERLCRYVSRPPIATNRLSLTPSNKICYQLKTPYRNGTTHMIFEPLDFISKLAGLVPLPRVNLTRSHGLFAPNNRHRADIIIRKGTKKSLEKDSPTASENRRAMTWAARLKRAFNIDIKKCESCGGTAKVIACIYPLHLKMRTLNAHLAASFRRTILKKCSKYVSDPAYTGLLFSFRNAPGFHR